MPKNDCPLQMGMEAVSAFEHVKGFACSTNLQYAYIPSLPTVFINLWKIFIAANIFVG